MLSRRFGSMINFLGTDQRVVAFNPSAGWSRDVSEDVARELERNPSVQGWEISERLQDFIEEQLGRKIGVQLPLPLHT